jgi:hypothetical protein
MSQFRCAEATVSAPILRHSADYTIGRTNCKALVGLPSTNDLCSRTFFLCQLVIKMLVTLSVLCYNRTDLTLTRCHYLRIYAIACKISPEGGLRNSCLSLSSSVCFPQCCLQYVRSSEAAATIVQSCPRRSAK